MRTPARILVALVFGIAAGAASVALVALMFYVLHRDPGIGGGLLAVGAGILVTIVITVIAYFVLSRPSSH